MEKKHKTALVISVAVILIASVGVGVMSTITPESLMAAALDNQPQYPEIDDGLHVLLLGTGAPLPDANRADPSTLVIAGTKHFVVDAGPGSTETMPLSGISPALVDAVFLTHFHSDHIGDLGELMLQRWALGGHNESLPVYGPVNVTSVVEGFNYAYQMDSLYRNVHHGEENMPINGSGGVAHEFDIGNDTMASQVIYEQDGVRVTMFNVNHTPVYPAVGYKFEYKGRSLAIGGDTVYCENLELQATDVDLLICEALNPEIVGQMEELAGEGVIPGDNNEVILHDIQEYHMTPEDAAALAENANVGYLVIHHMIPPLPDSPIAEGMFLGDAPQIFSGVIEIGKDGLLISMPADSEVLTRSNLLQETVPLPAYLVIPISVMLLILMFGVGWMITKNRQLKARTILAVFAVIMGLLFLTRIVAFIQTGFVIETVVFAAVEAIMLVWSIMYLKQDNMHNRLQRTEEDANQSLSSSPLEV